MKEDANLTPAQKAAAIDRVADSIALRSGAGCGKTLVLARRFAQLLVNHADMDDPMPHFVAVTFTDKAAMEMRQRVHKTLSLLAHQSPPAMRDLLRQWIDQLPEARISTIHGLCATLLRSHAVEAGIDPAFSVGGGDDLRLRQLCRDACEQAALAAVEAQDAAVLDLAAALTLDQIVAQVEDLIASRTAANLPQYAQAPAVMGKWKAFVERATAAAWARMDADAELRDSLRRLEQRQCTDPDDLLLARIHEILLLADGLLADPTSRTPQAFDALASITIGNAGSAKNWGGKEAVVETRADIRAVLASFKAYAPFSRQMGAIDEQAAEALAALVRLATDAIGRFSREKRRQGLLDFTDLLEHARRLMDIPAVAADIREQIIQLLLDEAQDTNGFQIDLLRQVIAQVSGDESGQGRLFVVGDAKQSIYRFNGAQVEVFESLCEQLGKAAQLDLNLCFRAHRPGVEFVNHLFAPLMPGRYVPIQAHRPVDPPGPSVEILLAEGGDDIAIDSADSAVTAQAAVLAQRIERMVAGGETIVWDQQAKSWRPVRYGDIAVLFSRMTVSFPFERQLALRDIPYYVVAGTGFFNQQEVFDVLNILAAIDNPYDDIGVFGVLRGGMFGLDDNAMMHLANACARPCFDDLASPALQGKLDADSVATVRAAHDLIASLLKRKDAVGIDQLIDDVLRATGFEAMLLSCHQGKRLAGNVRRLRELAREASGHKVALAEFIRQMRQQVIDESRFEQSAAAGEAENVVRLMTIHKAKGLEFPVVFVPDLNSGRQGYSDDILIRPDSGLTYRLRSPAPPEGDEGTGDEAAPLAYELARQDENRDLQSEDIRRFYVALTRHQDHLVLVGADWRTREGKFRSSGNYLATMDGVLGLAQLADDGRDIAYGDGNYSAIVRKVRPEPATSRGRKPSQGETILAAATSPRELAQGILAALPKAEPTPLAAPLPASFGQVSLAVTALSEFEHCPMLYHWRYELRVPVSWQTAATQAAPAASLDPATLGTLYHRCMELLDFAAPQPAWALVAQAAQEMDIHADLSPLADQLDAMIKTLLAGQLGRQLAAARQRLTELEFLADCPPGMLSGKIDLLYQDAAGAWHIVDYKSDRLGPDGVEPHARRYRLQMLIYLTAAGRHLQSAGHSGRVADATLYFLRTGQSHVISADEAAMAEADRRARSLAAALVAARRAVRFGQCQSTACACCGYKAYCDACNA